MALAVAVNSADGEAVGLAVGISVGAADGLAVAAIWTCGISDPLRKSRDLILSIVFASRLGEISFDMVSGTADTAGLLKAL